VNGGSAAPARIDTEATHTVAVGYDELCGALAAQNLQALWSLQRQLMPDVPVPTTLAWLWNWQTILPLAQRAGEVVTIERGGDRRVLALANPGLRGLPFTSTTLWGAVQYLGPGETAPAHRHTPSAIRFVMAGTGASTTVDGDACEMEPGDLILTPQWTWHDHNNRGDEPVVWFDGLDLPIVASLESIFFENHPNHRQPVDGSNVSERLLGTAGIAQSSAATPPAHSPLLRYARDSVDRSLEAVHDSGGGTIATVEYRNPLTGGPAIPTFSCEMSRIYPGQRTATSRKTGSSVYVAFRGSGRTVINGEAFEWGPGDIFVTPSWSAVDHESSEVADLFHISDRPILQALHLYREQGEPEHQPVGATFEAQ
jgi:gentisate 1,2-dioxygenase